MKGAHWDRTAPGRPASDQRERLSRIALAHGLRSGDLGRPGVPDPLPNPRQRTGAAQPVPSGDPHRRANLGLAVRWEVAGPVDPIVSRAMIAAVGLVGLLLLTSPASFHLPAAPHAPHDAGPSVAGAALSVHSLAKPSPSIPVSTVRNPATGIEPSHGLTRPASLLERPFSVINPKQSYSREPAPMGIADFGVTGAAPGGSAYEYFSPSFQGEARVTSMSVVISGSSSKVMAFELNAVILLQRDGVNYSYWIQNGLHLDAASHQYSIGGAYVWNFSSPTARLSVGELQGNAGSVLATDTYYYIPSCAATFPGQCTALTLPTTLLGRIVSSTSGGIPFVEYDYNLGAGWVAYDNVSFLHMVGASDPGFRVSGFTPTPIATNAFYDAEWVWVGAGGGSAAVDQQSDIDLALDRWNGHNYQAVPTAWNFGSNTGETSSNVSVLPTTGNAAGPTAHVVSGPGTLGVLYNGSTVGFLNLSVPFLSAETAVIDGDAVPVQGGWTNLTLLAGTHSLYLQNYSNASQSFDIAPGGTTFVDLSGAGRLAFSESGLPGGTTWGVTVNGTTLSGLGGPLVFHLPNGTYPVAYLPVPGFYRNASSPLTVSLPGPSDITVEFAPFTYAVTFTESGLPDATSWWVDLNGTRINGTGTTLQALAPNGSSPFEVGSSYEFVATPDSGAVVVTNGLSFPESIEFTYRPTFIVGTVLPVDAEVSIGGVIVSVVGGSYNDSVIPGAYVLVAHAVGFANQSFDVTATPGNVTWANVSLVANETPSPTPGYGESSDGAIPLTVAALVVVGAVVAAAAVLLVLRSRRR